MCLRPCEKRAYSTLSPFRLSSEQRSAPNAYVFGYGLSSTGSSGDPPWSTRLLPASFSAAESSIVVAPSMLVPVRILPWPSRSGIVASVVTSVRNAGVLVTDKEPQCPVTRLGEMPGPNENPKPVSGRQFGCISCSWVGFTSWPAWYWVFGPRSRRLSWMLLRLLLALMSV